MPSEIGAAELGARSLAFCIFGRAAQLEWVPAEPGLFLGSFFRRVAVTGGACRCKNSHRKPEP
jgi:hypothetical protein